MKPVLHKCFFGWCTYFMLLTCTGCHLGRKGITFRQDDNQAMLSDTTSDMRTILGKENSMVMADKLEDAIAYISVNLHRFHSTERAMLINERGGIYALKNDQYNAIADYLSASELAPDSSCFILNAAAAYSGMGKDDNAVFFAKKVIGLPNASDSDKVEANAIIDKYNSHLAGH